MVVAENGQLALDLCLTAQQAGKCFDLVLMDMQMPVMDGYQATQKLRRANFTTPIIALTAHAMSEDRQKCLTWGATITLPSPLMPRDWSIR